jgi:hypothetical protein
LSPSRAFLERFGPHLRLLRPNVGPQAEQPQPVDMAERHPRQQPVAQRRRIGTMEGIV